MPDRLKKQCKTCSNQAKRVWRHKHPDHAKRMLRRWRLKNPERWKVLHNRYERAKRADNVRISGVTEPGAHAYRLKKHYGLTVEQYREMLSAQHAVCRICGKPETVKHNGRVRPLSVDHCHKTGTVRGLLCQGCNTRLAQLEWLEDNPTWLAAARKHCDAPAFSGAVRCA